ncbi:max dimerization protein 3 [Notechis scutatus]|uniref:Max dimerization protein 3 n=1 Tax=Notechis scutatus TaxID=8663 RepID=A0A6J1UDY6_9SAUR|nr:max dimerization protein 3 [Notechis scutatus]
MELTSSNIQVLRERSVHNELEKHRRAQLRHCLDQLKQQISTNTEHSRYTMLSLLHRARLHIKKLEHQEQKAQQVKERLRCERQNLHQRLEELQAHLNTEQAEADSLDSPRFSSEHSDSEDEVDIEGLACASIGDAMAAFSTQQEHSYSNVSNFWLWTEAQLGQHSSRQASNFSEITSWQGN